MAITVSAAPYAYRHWALRNENSGSHYWRHIILAIVEAIPGIGALAGLIERIVVAIRSCFSSFSSAERESQREAAAMRDMQNILRAAPHATGAQVLTFKDRLIRISLRDGVIRREEHSLAS
jgi:hypothetical protein